MVKRTSQVISDFFSIIFPGTPSTSSNIHEEEADLEESRSSGAMASSMVFSPATPSIASLTVEADKKLHEVHYGPRKAHRTGTYVN